MKNFEYQYLSPDAKSFRYFQTEEEVKDFILDLGLHKTVLRTLHRNLLLETTEKGIILHITDDRKHKHNQQESSKGLKSPREYYKEC